MSAADACGDVVGDLYTAITSALAAAREAGRREVLEGAAGVEEAIEDHRRAAWDEALCNANTSAGAPMDVVQATFDAADAIRAAIAADKARAVEAASDAAFDRGRAATIKYADGLVMRPVLSREDADALIDALGRGVRDLWRSAHNTPERSKALDDHDTARTALIAALTGAPMSDATSRFDNACPHDGCGGEMEGGEFSDGSENNCTKCGKVAVCAEYEGGTFGWRAYDPEEPDDDDAALTGAGGGS